MTKGPLLQEIWDDLPAERKARIAARTRDLAIEYLTLQELRKAAGLTQAEVSQELGVPQSNVSRLEKGADMLLSTLRQYVEALGGKLNLTVELPDKPPIRLNLLSDLVDQQGNTERSQPVP
ncbi:MAG: helix-turn-helix domain-containing protein [Caldilinea sp. CFX5]|nr:helix-turn-helix domain-containing protein [Caldilinea sp. CFX5]